MKRKNLLKSIIVIGLCLVLALSFTDFVFAADSSDDFDWDNATVVGNNTSNTVDDEDTNTSNNLLNSVSNNVTNNVTNNTANTNSTNNVSNNLVSTNELAYTGSGNAGIIAIIIVAGAIITIYSYIKIREYKNI